MSLILAHSRCGSQVRIDACSIATILGGISFSSKGVILTDLKVSKVASVINNPKFICTNCGDTDVKKESIIFVCMYCSTAFPLTEICIPNKSNGAYCPSCFSKKFSDEEKLDFDTLIKKVYFR